MRNAWPADQFASVSGLYLQWLAKACLATRGNEVPSFQFEFHVTTGLAAVAGIGYVISCARRREGEFSLIDSLLLVILMSIATAGGITIAEAAPQNAKTVVARENLRTFRTQIEACKQQHCGELPVLYNGVFPQWTEATNASAIPGRADAKHPYGPYFRAGIPVNPLTGKSTVTPTELFPPTKPSGNGGWLYNQKTGKMAIDLAEHLYE